MRATLKWMQRCRHSCFWEDTALMQRKSSNKKKSFGRIINDMCTFSLFLMRSVAEWRFRYSCSVYCYADTSSTLLWNIRRRWLHDVANFDSPSVSAVGLPSSKEGVSIIAVVSRVWCLSPVGSEKVSLLSKYQKLHILYISIIIHYTLDSWLKFA